MTARRTRRLAGLLREQGYSAQEVDAVLALAPQRLGDIPKRLAAVREAYDTYIKGGTLNAEEGLSRFAIRYICSHHYFSHARATRELGYVPRVRMAEGIQLAIADARAHGLAAK